MATDVAPVAVEYVLAMQSVHALLPVTVLYFPAWHCVQGPPSGPVDPAAQGGSTQLLASVLPAGEVVPAAQAMHVAADVAPVAVEYVLAMQSVHTGASAAPEYFPATHCAQDVVVV